MLWKFAVFVVAMAGALYVGWLMIRWSAIVKLDERTIREQREAYDEHQDSWRDR